MFNKKHYECKIFFARVVGVGVKFNVLKKVQWRAIVIISILRIWHWLNLENTKKVKLKSSVISNFLLFIII